MRKSEDENVTVELDRDVRAGARKGEAGHAVLIATIVGVRPDARRAATWRNTAANKFKAAVKADKQESKTASKFQESASHHPLLA